MYNLDDVIIFRRTFHDYNQRLGLVLNLIEEAGLVLNSRKCHFGKRPTLLLGFFDDRNGLRPDPQKIAAVRDFNERRSLQDLERFLGLFSYFRCFLQDFCPA